MKGKGEQQLSKQTEERKERERERAWVANLLPVKQSWEAILKREGKNRVAHYISTKL